jgi:putative PIN family toxin of toxin-antitoxin system
MPSPAHLARPLRLVLDTNVVVAGLLWSGPPRRLIERAFETSNADRQVALFSSAALLAELAHTLAYPKFRPRMEAFGTTAATLVAHYTALVSLVVPAQVPRVVANDADDDQVIAAAVAAQADWIVTGDRKHLLPIGVHQGIAILDAAEALRRLQTPA